MINMTAHCRKTATLLALAAALLCNLALAQDANFPRSEMPESAFLPAVSVLENGLMNVQERGVQQSSSVPFPPGTLNVYQDFEPAIQPAEELDILTRGPLHEAFATAHQPNPTAASLVAKSPPALIDELPPKYKPEGKNVKWIAGYWAWDDSLKDFIWVSGVWRDVPPNRRWVSGYWEQVDGGHRWVSGLWAEEQQQELGYLPAPPASIDQGPSTLSPSENHFYVPGNWEYQNKNYRWMSGHWQPVVENWIWIPARYVWTPRGCVYQSGYWDYEFDQRGACFAPVHFNRPVYQQASYRYQPSHAIHLNIDFLTHLFVRPNCGHYFYGDWYSSGFVNSGYRPWSSYRSHSQNYDPLLAYYRSRRSSFDARLNTVQYLANQHSFYARNRDYRPRPTFSAQVNYVNNHRHVQYSDYLRKSNYVGSYSNLLRDAQREREKKLAKQKRNAIEAQRKYVKEAQRRNEKAVRDLARDNKNRQTANNIELAAERRKREFQQRLQRQQYELLQRKQTSQRDDQLQQRRAEEKRQSDLAQRQRDQKQRVNQEKRLAEDRARKRQREIGKRRGANEAARKARERQLRDQVNRTQADQKRRADEAARQAKREQDAARRAQEKAQRDTARRAQQDRDAAKQAQRKREAAQKAAQSKRDRDLRRKRSNR